MVGLVGALFATVCVLGLGPRGDASGDGVEATGTELIQERKARNVPDHCGEVPGHSPHDFTFTHPGVLSLPSCRSTSLDTFLSPSPSTPSSTSSSTLSSYYLEYFLEYTFEYFLEYFLEL